MGEINGNTRDIKVPAQLQKCAGIENDHMAESIMFLIDRYHDSMDLANASIYIQWKANGAQGQVHVPHIDVDYEENKIRFPWPLDSNVTSHPGDIEFSIVFFIYFEGTRNVAYRYSTLTKKIRIEPALQPDITDSPIEVGGNFAMAVRTNDYGPGFYLPVVPYFTASQYGKDLEGISNLDYSNDDNGVLALTAQATVTDTGRVIYNWKYIAPESTLEFNCGEGQTRTINKGTKLTSQEISFINERQTKIEYVETTGETKVLEADKTISDLVDSSSGKTLKQIIVTYSFGDVDFTAVAVSKKNRNTIDRYFKNEEDAKNANVTAYMTKKELEETTGKVYERLTRLTLPSSGQVTGKYFVVAYNYIQGNGTVSNKRSIDVTSTVTELQRPQDVVITDQNFETVVLGSDGVLLDPHIVPVEGENYKATVLYSNSDTTNLLMANTQNYFNNKPSKSLTTDNKIEIPTTTDSQGFPGGTGWYKAMITARRNRENKYGYSKIWRVINKVAAPQIVNLTTTSDNILSIDKTSPESSSDYIYNVNIRDEKNDIVLRVGFNGGETIEEKYEYDSSREGDNCNNSLLSDSFSIIWKDVTNPDRPEVIESAVTTDPPSQITLKNVKENQKISCTLINRLNGETEKSTLLYTIS